MLPNTLTTIDSIAFQNCEQLASVNVGEYITKIGNGAFSGTFALSDENGFVVFNHVLHCFANKSAKDVVIPSGITAIGYAAFEGCAVESVILSETVTSIGAGAFIATRS